MQENKFTCIGKGHGAPAVPASREEWEKLRREPWLAQMCERIQRGEERLKSMLPIWTPSCAEFKNNHRCIADALKPLSRLMLDFDEKGHSQEILEKALQLNEQGKWEILLVEESVRKGTHVLITLPIGMSAQEAQIRFSEDVGFKADPALKDIARCIYMVPEGNTLFVSEGLFSPSPLVILNEVKDLNTSTNTPVMSFRVERSEAKNLENINVDVLEILPPYGRLNDKNKESQNDKNNGLQNDKNKGNPNLPLVKGEKGGCSIGQAVPTETVGASTSPLPPSKGGESDAPLSTPNTPITPPSGGDGGGLGFPTTYNDIPYKTIVETLEEQMGGHPEHGSRNNFIFSMACHLRYVCNDDPDWIATVLPTYGEGREKWMHSIRSACARNQTQAMPNIMRRTLSICKQILQSQGDTQVSTSDANPPKMPDKLPPLIELLVSRTPDIYKPAVAHAVFPPLAAHLWKTYFRYIDNVLHEATLMNVLMAGTGAGKNCISEPINRILADIRRRDRENMYREKAWKKEMQSTGANKNKRQRPEGLVIQEIDPDMTNAAFVQRLADAEERFLYTKMNEIDQFDALKTAANRKSQFQIMCLAFDPGNVYGQTRIGTGSVTERVCIRFNWNASTTIGKGQAYFRSVLTDGPISRINFCTIPEREIGAPMPVYGSYDDEFDRQLAVYIDRLNASRGEVECPEAFALAQTLSEECAEFSRLSQSRVYENLSFRANVIAYLKAMVLYVAHGYWDATMEDFVRWSLKYDMWCKMHFFGEAIENLENGAAMEKQKPGPRNLLDLLPDCFTREDAQLMRQRQGIQTGRIQDMLDNWRKRGYIIRTGEKNPDDINQQRFEKTEMYLRNHRSVGQSVN